MVLKTIIVLASSAFAAANISVVPTVHTEYIKRSYECTHAPNNCAPGLVCAGFDHKKTCVVPKNPGKQCRIEPFWVCRSDLVCENDVCKIPAGGNCAKKPDQCAAGTECVGSDDDRTCRAPRPELGEDCDADENKCVDGLTCDGNTCKLPRGATCTDNPDQCAGDIACDGKGAEKRCIIYKEPGMGCPVRENFWICRPGLTCEDDKCKIPVGTRCETSPDNCADGSECVGTGAGDAKVCQPIRPKLGEDCEADGPKCADGLTCDKEVCKLPENSVCTKTPDLCAGDLSCDGKGAEKRCNTYNEPGMGCAARKKFAICRPGLICENDVCKIPVGVRCDNSPRNCVIGSACTGNRKSKTCQPIKPKLGEECDAAGPKCEDGLTCDNHVCKLPKNSVCTKTPDLCAGDLSCDGKGSEKRCITYNEPGMGCAARKKFAVCKPGLTCENDVCKIPVGVRCDTSPRNCVGGSACAGTRKGKICQPIKSNVGEKCGVAGLRCASGLTCEKRVCKFPRFAVCNKAPKFCASGLSCDGKRSVKRCISYKRAGMRCPRKEDFWICARGLTCQRDVCRIPLGGACAISPRSCVSGASCVGSGRGRKCAVPLSPAGGRCDGRKKRCARGLACQKGRCRIPIGHSCTTAPWYCVIGAKCFGSRRSRKCIKPLARAGQKCNRAVRCARGLTCDRVCRLVRGARCDHAPRLCARGLRCDGKRSKRVCTRSGGYSYRPKW